MEIISRKTGKRNKEIDIETAKALKKDDPVIKAEKELDIEENSPMDPPEAYKGSLVSDVHIEEMHSLLQNFINEHKKGLEKIDAFEKGLVEFKENGYQLNALINDSFSQFFQFFDTNLIDHNQREEKQLFPLLHKRLIENGESGKGENPHTAVDMLEDDHIKFIQLGALAFNMLGLAARISDEKSRMFVYDTAFHNGRELVELLRLHIYREENILFPLAHKFISINEFDQLMLV